MILNSFYIPTIQPDLMTIYNNKKNIIVTMHSFHRSPLPNLFADIHLAVFTPSITANPQDASISISALKFKELN